MRKMLLVALIVLAFPATASAREMWVDPGRGSDRAPGTRAQPLRSVDEAWSRIPARRALSAPVTLQLAREPQRDSKYWGNAEAG